MPAKIEKANIGQVADVLFGDKEDKKEIFKEAVKKGKAKRTKGYAGGELASSIAMLGVTAMLGNIMLGGLTKMFGDKNIEPRELVTAMIDGFMVYIEEGREKLKEKNDEIVRLETELDMKKRHYEEMSEAADKLRAEVSTWKSKYMKMVSNSRKPTVYGTKKKK